MNHENIIDKIILDFDYLLILNTTHLKQTGKVPVLSIIYFLVFTNLKFGTWSECIL